MLTVVTPAASTRLATLAQVKAELSITGDDSDTYLGDLLDQASAAIASHCRRVFGLEEVSETIRLLRHTGSLLLARAPVAAVASVTEDSNLLDAAEYELDAPAGMLFRLIGDCLARWCARKVVVQYTAGWSLPNDESANLPADIRRACVLYVTSMHEAQGRDPMVRAEQQEGVGQVSYIATADMGCLPPQVEALLAPWRLAA
jgi:uncharacterized phiE125 gp8 family phage protein